MSNIRKGVIISFLCCTCLAWLNAQEQSALPAQRPKVGLVLSGGSAHGFAHIGVLKYLEEAGIELDYITGTSMGSVIGGLYAMGLSANEIQDIAAGLDWDVIMSNEIPLNEVAPVEKQFHAKSPISLLWKDNGFKLPAGLIRGQKLDLVINQVYSPAVGLAHFDDLHIPFRCVAIDIEDGSIDVFEDGFLGDAIRASMSIPTVFPPKEINNVLYVDGGLYRNFPVEEVKAMGADIVIGVYVGSDKKKKDELTSMIDVMRQAASLAGINDSYNQVEMVDIFIEPDVKDESSFDFNRHADFIEKGYAASKKNKKLIEKLSKTLSHYDSPQKNPRLTYSNTIRFKKIHTMGSSPVFNEMIDNFTKFWEGYATPVSKIDEGLSLLYGTKNFSSIDYNLRPEGDDIHLEIDANDVTPYSIGINVNQFRNFGTGIILSGEARNVFGKPSSLHLNARISERPGVQAGYMIRLPSLPSCLFRISGKWEQFALPWFQGARVLRRYNFNQSFFRAELLKELNNSILIKSGITFREDLIRPENNADSNIIQYKTNRSEVFLSMEHNTYDRPSYPRKGFQYNIDVRYIFNNRIDINQTDSGTEFSFQNDSNYFSIDANYNRIKRLAHNLFLQMNLHGRISNGNTLLDHYRIGGPRQEKSFTYGFAGINEGGILAGNHISGFIGLRWEMTSSLYVTPNVQYFYGDRFEPDNRIVSQTFGFGLDLDYNSPIGPINLIIGYSGYTDRLDLNFGLGYRHIL